MKKEKQFFDFSKEELDEIQDVLYHTAMQSGAMMPPAPCLIKAHQRHSGKALTERKGKSNRLVHLRRPIEATRKG